MKKILTPTFIYLFLALALGMLRSHFLEAINWTLICYYLIQVLLAFVYLRITSLNVVESIGFVLFAFLIRLFGAETTPFLVITLRLGKQYLFLKD